MYISTNFTTDSFLLQYLVLKLNQVINKVVYKKMDCAIFSW